MARSSTTLEKLVGVLAFAVAYATMRLLGAGTNIRILAGALVGFLLALIPYFVARRKGLSIFASRSLAAGAVVGAIGGALFALPLSIVLAIIAWRKQPLPPPTTVPSAGMPPRGR